jgi:hypothetical protein
MDLADLLGAAGNFLSFVEFEKRGEEDECRQR